MTDYTIKDSGERREFSTGAVRDRGELKPRPDLIHPYFLFRLGMHLARGAKKYSAWNWSKGMPVSEFFASANRHLVQAMTGDESEDHLSAVAFNVMGAMVVMAGVRAGIYPPELMDMHDLGGWIEPMEKLAVPALDTSGFEVSPKILDSTWTASSEEITQAAGSRPEVETDIDALQLQEYSRTLKYRDQENRRRAIEAAIWALEGFEMARKQNAKKEAAEEAYRMVGIEQPAPKCSAGLASQCRRQED